MTEPESNRAQLTEQIIEGNVDLMLIATVLVKEVLPALDRISKQIAYRLVLAEMAMAQIGVIYEHLQELAPSRKDSTARSGAVALARAVGTCPCLFGGKGKAMTRTLTIKEYLLEELNRRARERGEDVELVFERPRPELVADRGVVVPLRAAGTEERANG